MYSTGLDAKVQFKFQLQCKGPNGEVLKVIDCFMEKPLEELMGLAAQLENNNNKQEQDNGIDDCKRVP